MSFTERLMQQGEFNIPLTTEFPDAILNSMEPFDQIIILAQRLRNPARWSDDTLRALARYGGPILMKEIESAPRQIIGAGMTWYLGDDLGLGPKLETLRTFTNANIATVFATTGLLPAAIEAGVITEGPISDYTNTHQWEDPIAAIRTASPAMGVEWRINPNATIDVASVNSNAVYRNTNPEVVIVREDWGQDSAWVGVHANRALSRIDARGAITRSIITEEESDGSQSLVEDQDANVTYYDPHGNLLIRTKINTRPADSTADSGAFLEADIKRNGIKTEVEIDTEQFEIARGRPSIGDWCWVHDPRAGIFGPIPTIGTFYPTIAVKQIRFRGRLLVPWLARVMEATTQLVEGMGVYWRPSVVAPASRYWVDISQWVDWEYRSRHEYSRLIVDVAPQPMEVGSE